MNPRHSLQLSLLLLVCLGCAPTLRAQQRCQPPVPQSTTRAQNFFTPQQEMDLGDAIAEHIQRDSRVIEDEEVTAHLREVGARLVKQLPPTEIHFQFFLFDQPVANAFALPGGRIYVSRKLVAFTRTEDELASVLSHEMGHIIARQGAIEMTRRLREVLGVQQVTDRRDIFDKYNQLVENVARKPKAFSRDDEEKDQYVADQLGLFALANAGYDPQTFASFWDRFAETKGKKGNVLSDLFGTTKPESRRLREMLKSVAAVPADCIAAHTPTPVEEYLKWQAAVINYNGLGRKEALHNVLSKKILDPPLRGDITYLRFSPDGKYLLAQDDAGINVLSREPFAPLFRIEALEANPAQFTPDSQAIVFYSSGLRVETWSVADAQVKSTHEMVIRKKCLQTALAPDGKTLACLDADFNLDLFDVATNAQVWQKKSFYTPTNFFELLMITLNAIINNEDELDLLHVGFSPDSHYFAAGQGENSIALDLSTRTEVSLHGPLKKLIAHRFTFIAPDKLIGADPGNMNNSPLVAFPSGEVLDKIPLGGGELAAPANGNYLMIRPIKDFPVGVINLATKKIFIANKQSAFDLYGDVFVSEQINGELGLYGVEKQEMRSKVILPRNSLGRVRAADLSANQRYLAISERSRGAVWDLNKGERLFQVRGFRGAYFAGDGTLYADFPKYEASERAIGRLNLATHQVVGITKMEEARATQYGPFILQTKPAKKEGNLQEDITMEMRDTRSGATLWTKGFPKEAPKVWVEAREGTMALAWATSADAVKLETKGNPALSQRLAAMKEKEGDYFLQMLDTRTGATLGSLLIETGKGSFRIEDVTLAGDWVVITDTENRVLVYSLKTGEQKGKVFGRQPVIAKVSNLLCVENERGQLTVYDLATMTKRDQFTFSSPIALAQFNDDGKKLFVLTANQTAYVLNLSTS